MTESLKVHVAYFLTKAYSPTQKKYEQSLEKYQYITDNKEPLSLLL